MTGPLFAGRDRAARASSCPATYFNPRTPCGVRLFATWTLFSEAQFQSTHPLWGATSPSRRAASLRSNFNPRTPCGVRPSAGRTGDLRGNFNPRTPCGVRLDRNAVCDHVQVFQSTHPLRGATRHLWRFFMDGLFQSTHPLRGATILRPISADASEISIHAPLAGCDSLSRFILGPSPNFNPRTPCGVRPLICRNIWGEFLFQSTHPLRGATRRMCSRIQGFSISIHAPLAGCDNLTKGILWGWNDFNPRTPCGERLPVQLRTHHRK